jgi:hypothetical protein
MMAATYSQNMQLFTFTTIKICVVTDCILIVVYYTDTTGVTHLKITVEPWIASNLVCECFTRRAKILKEF